MVLSCKQCSITKLLSSYEKKPTKLNQAQYTIFYTEKMTNLPKGKNIDTTNLKPRTFIHTEVDLYSLTFISGLPYMLICLCTKTIMI